VKRTNFQNALIVIAALLLQFGAFVLTESSNEARNAARQLKCNNHLTTWSGAMYVDTVNGDLDACVRTFGETDIQ